MKWLTIADIKKHLRVDFDDEDDVLELYGSAAEDTVLNYLNRTYQDVLEEYGEVPASIRQATLMLVDSSFNHRSPAEPTQMYYVMYGFDTLIKPYMRLTSSGSCLQRVSTYTIGSQIKILVAATLPDNLRLFDVDFVRAARRAWVLAERAATLDVMVVPMFSPITRAIPW